MVPFQIRYATLFSIAFLLFLFAQMLLISWLRSPSLEEIMGKDETVEIYCSHPHLDIVNPLILKHIRDVGELSCKRETDWVEIHHGFVSINSRIIKRHGFISCSLTYFNRIDDFSTTEGKNVELTSADHQISLEDDFFRVKCESADGLTWENIMAGISRNEFAVKQLKSLKLPEYAMPLNVLIFGLDSMSRLHYMRKLPKTYKYLTEVLKGIVLKGYNIVGDGTPQALIPILTGYTELELPETRKRISGANFVNVYPFIWNNFSAHGYVTAYGEDGPQTGTFTYRLKGFREMPTDHYIRTFYIEVMKELRKHPEWCLGNKPRHVVMLDWLRQFYDAYPDVPKFAFLLHSELSHDDYNLVGYTDSDIERFLKDLNDDGVLNDTLLILMSDHGHRFAGIRETQQGKQEERLPFFSLVLPPWFQNIYPNFVQNLQINQNRLVTPFDIHATLMTLLHPEAIPNEGDINRRSISLFSRIPKKRTCSAAFIEPHWCACLSWTKISVEDPIAKEVGQAVINFINKLTEFQRVDCHILSLEEVMRIEKLQPRKALLKFGGNADLDGFVGKFTDDTKVTDIIFQVQIRASPSNAIYEASLKHSVLKNVFLVKEDELSRVNMYGDQAHCIQDTYPNLRKYCYCKKPLLKKYLKIKL